MKVQRPKGMTAEQAKIWNEGVKSARANAQLELEDARADKMDKALEDIVVKALKVRRSVLDVFDRQVCIPVSSRKKFCEIVAACREHQFVERQPDEVSFEVEIEVDGKKESCTIDIYHSQ